MGINHSKQHKSPTVLKQFWLYSCNSSLEKQRFSIHSLGSGCKKLWWPAVGLQSSLLRQQTRSVKAPSVKCSFCLNWVQPPVQEDRRDQGSSSWFSIEWEVAAEELENRNEVSKASIRLYSNSSSNSDLLMRWQILPPSMFSTFVSTAQRGIRCRNRL